MEYTAQIIYTVNSDDFAGWIHTHFPEVVEYDFSTTEDVGSGSVHFFKVPCTLSADDLKFHQAEIAEIRANGYAPYGAPYLLQELVLQKVIPGGPWLILT